MGLEMSNDGAAVNTRDKLGTSSLYLAVALGYLGAGL